MTNPTVPTVAGPNINLQGINPNGIFSAVAQTAEIPKVSNVADASRYPAKAGTQDVLLDTNDPEIAYFRQIDVNGFVQVDRRRCVPEPEPTQEQINDQKYLSRKEFTDFMDEFRSFRKEMTDNVRVFSAGAVTTPATISESDSGNRESKVSIPGNPKRNQPKYAD